MPSLKSNIRRWPKSVCLVNFELLVLSTEVRSCTLCAAHLPLGPRPVFQVHPNARILIAGQAPGTRVHDTGIPFDDPSGDRLRLWLGVSREEFYDETKFAILPMGFCYPGRGSSGDLPPRPECAVAWRKPMLAMMPKIGLTLAIGQFAIDWHLAGQQKSTLTDTVQNWSAYWPMAIPLPHPSPRNNIWLKKNAWFEAEVVPELRKRVAATLSDY